MHLIRSLGDRVKLRELAVVKCFHADEVKLIMHHFRKAIRQLNEERSLADGEQKQPTKQDFPMVESTRLRDASPIGDDAVVDDTTKNPSLPTSSPTASPTLSTPLSIIPKLLATLLAGRNVQRDC